MQKPTISRIVHYTLTESDAEAILRHRTTGHAIAQRIAEGTLTIPNPGDATPHNRPLGAQAYIGNGAQAGEVYPAIIVRVWGTDDNASVNLQVFLDGNDTYWATSKNQVEDTDKPATAEQMAGRFFFPVIVRHEPPKTIQKAAQEAIANDAKAAEAREAKAPHAKPAKLDKAQAADTKE